MAMVPVITIERMDGAEENPAFRIDGARWYVEYDGLENFDGVTYSITTGEYAQYDGSWLKGERATEVDRTIVAHSAYGYDIMRARSEAEAFFLPGRTYRVHVSYGGRERYCEGRQYALKVEVPPGQQLTQRVTWTVLCLEPYWQSEDSKSFDIAEATPCFGFPFLSFSAGKYTVPEADEPGGSAETQQAVTRAAVDGTVPDHIAGFISGVLSKTITLRNDGSAAAYPRFDITASDAVANPSVTIQDGAGNTVASVVMDLTMKAGDALVLDFSTRPASITLNGKNATNLSRYGTSMVAGIDVGTFSITWGATSGDAAMRVIPSIRERYPTI